MKKLVLLDGHAIIHRAFHAIPEKFSTKSGEPTNAVFGFTSILLNVIELEKPDCLAVAFDRKGKTFRHHADENYKAQRAKTAPELIAQIRRVYEITRAFSIPIFAENGFEADDILGGICEKMELEPEWCTIVVSGDRDLLQLVDAKTFVHDLAGGYRAAVKFDAAAVEKKFGFEPRFIPDFKGLAGDASDNLRGVAGVGPKTATELIREFGTLENIFANLEKVKSTVAAKLKNDRDSAFHSKKMATIRRDAQIEFDLAKCGVADFDRAEVVTLFDELEFHSLEKRLGKIFPAQKVEVAAPVEQPRLF